MERTRTPQHGNQRWLAGLLWKRSVASEVESEIAFHLEMRQRELMERGVPAPAAQAAARARFGGVDEVAEECRSLARSRDRRWRVRNAWNEAVQDGRLAWRQMARAPRLAAACALLLGAAVGVALTTVAISEALRQPAGPVLDPERLVQVWSRSPAGAELPASDLDYRAWRNASGLTGAAASSRREATLSGIGPPRRIIVARATASLFAVVGVAAELGRTMGPMDESGTGDRRIAVLGDALWRTSFSGARDVLDREVLLDGVPFRIVGVMPPGFSIPGGVEAWLPLGPDSAAQRRAAGDRRELQIVARLGAGAAVSAVERELETIAAERARRSPATHRGWSVAVEPLATRRGPVRMRLALLEGASLALWLAAAAHGALLLLGRVRQRRRELDLRAALGAGRVRILRQLIVECLPLAGGGVVLGFLCGLTLIHAASRVDGLAALSADRPAHLLGLATLLGGVTALLWSVVALLGVRPGESLGLGRARRAVGPRARRVRDLLIGAQASLAMLLLVGGGLMARGLATLEARAPSLDGSPVVALRLAMNGERYAPQRRRDLIAEAEREISRLPGVLGVAASSATPWESVLPNVPFTLASEERPAAAVSAEWRSTTPGLLPTLGLTLRRGRFLSAGDRNGKARVAVIDEVLAHELWGSADPLGRRLRSGALTLTVVGVVAPVHDGDFEAARRPLLFVPYGQWPWREMSFLIKARLGAPVGPAAAAVLHRLAPELATSAPVDLRAARRHAAAGSLPAAVSLICFALAALLLAVRAVYGVTASTAAEQRGEGGLAAALGVSKAVLCSGLLRPGLLPTLCGGALGGGLALIVTPVLSTSLFGAEALDLATHATGWVLLAGSAAGASLLGARRSSRAARRTADVHVAP